MGRDLSPLHRDHRRARGRAAVPEDVDCVAARGGKRALRRVARLRADFPAQAIRESPFMQ